LSLTIESIFIRLAVIGSQICEIPRNSERIRTYSRSRSSKVIDLGVNGKRMCDFLSVINSNLRRISCRFRDFGVQSWKIARLFSHPSLVWRLRSGETP